MILTKSPMQKMKVLFDAMVSQNVVDNNNDQRMLQNLIVAELTYRFIASFVDYNPTELAAEFFQQSEISVYAFVRKKMRENVAESDNVKEITFLIQSLRSDMTAYITIQDYISEDKQILIDLFNMVLDKMIWGDRA